MIEQHGTRQTPYGFTGEMEDETGLLYLRARYLSSQFGNFLSLDPFEGMVDRPMSLNGYSYVEGNPVNWTDASGLCPDRRQIESNPARRTTENYYDALEIEQCHQMSSELRTWGVNVVWDASAIDPYWVRQNCLSNEVVAACNPERGLRWTTNEMRAIFNAFKVFEAARNSIGFMHYPWPLANKSITVEKRPTVEDNALGIHSYFDRRITMSAIQWGEFSSLHRPRITDNGAIVYVPIGNEYRSWLVLHEFSHIFIKDQDSDDPEGYGTSRFPNKMRLEGEFTSDRGLVTAYSFVSDYEAATEAVTGTLWNNGYAAIPAFDETGGGRTGQFNAVGLDRYGSVNRAVSNVRKIKNSRGQTLEEWIIAELKLRSS